MKLIVGLGNPGAEYDKSRHNAGFIVLDAFAKRLNADLDKPREKFHSLVKEAQFGDDKLILLWPQTYMNRCGIAVREAMTFYKLRTADVLIIVDDLALPCGKIRIRPDGGAGGHNGLKDVQNHLNSSKYSRLRIGIDPRGQIPQVPYVLGKFTEEQTQALNDNMAFTCDCIEAWAREGTEYAMNHFNGG